MFSYKTSLSSSSSSAAAASSRRPKNGLNSNKNKLLKDESNGLSFNNNNNNKNDMQLVSHSSYWPSASENVKRSQQQSENIGGGDESEFNLKEYSLLGNGMPLSSSSSSSYEGIGGSNANDDEVMYDDDYDVNGFFNSVNQDNINDFYFYINNLLSKKPNQKTI